MLVIQFGQLAGLPQRHMSTTILEQIVVGRTDLVFDYLAAGHAVNSTDRSGVSLIKWCAYYGDVSAIRFLLTNGESLKSLGENLDLNGAAFHGHWRLCYFLIEHGADVNRPLADTGETPLHSPLTWASWHLRPDSVLRKLCYGEFHIHPKRRSMAAYLLGEPHV